MNNGFSEYCETMYWHDIRLLFLSMKTGEYINTLSYRAFYVGNEGEEPVVGS